MLQLSFVLLSMKRKHHARDGFLKELCCLFQRLLPEDNLMPPSWYLMRKLVGCVQPQAWLCHTC